MSATKAQLEHRLAGEQQTLALPLRALIRNAQRELEMQKPPKNYREIFQVLREIIPEQE